MLDDTLIVWGGEFGRQPTAEYAKGTGRDHNAYGFTMWMAGGGIKGGDSRKTSKVKLKQYPTHREPPACGAPVFPLRCARRHHSAAPAHSTPFARPPPRR